MKSLIIILLIWVIILLLLAGCENAKVSRATVLQALQDQYSYTATQYVNKAQTALTISESFVQEGSAKEVYRQLYVRMMDSALRYADLRDSIHVAYLKEQLSNYIKTP